MLALPLQSTVPARVRGRQVSALFAGGQVGGNLSFTDFSKIWKDSAGTTPYTAVEQYVGKIIDKSPNALAFTQATSAARPVVSARVNLISGSEATGGSGGTPGTAPDGWVIHQMNGTYSHTMESGKHRFSAEVGRSTIRTPIIWLPNTSYTTTITLTNNGVATNLLNIIYAGLINGTTGLVVDYYVDGVLTTTVDHGTHKVKIVASFTSGTPLQYIYIGAGASSPLTADITLIDASVTLTYNATLPYQRVNTPTDYDTAGFPYYLKLDGIDDNVVSAAGGGGTAGIYFCGAIQFNKVGAAQTIFSDAGTNTGYKVQLTAANQLQIAAGNGTAFTAINTTDVFALGDVSLCELWDDGTNLGVRLGEGTPVTVARPVVTAGTAQITMGKDNNAASNYAGIGMFEPVWRYGAMPNTTQREAIRAICRSKAGIA